MRGVATIVFASGCFFTPERPLAPPEDSGVDHDADRRVIDAPADAQATTEAYAFVTTGTSSVNVLQSRVAADAFCQAHADLVSLPGRYIAWISDSQGPLQFLVGATGWTRVDGKPITEDRASLADGKIYHPIDITERNVRLSGVPVLTGTQPSGAPHSATCNGLTPQSGGVIAIGLSDATTARWTNSGTTMCSETAHLYCFRSDAKASFTIMPAMGRLAFLSTAWAPKMGLDGADAHCLADANTRTETRFKQFRAFMGATNVQAKSRLPDGLPWVRLDGVPIAPTALDVLAGELTAPLNLDINMNYVGGVAVWTGANATGSPDDTAQADCFNWSSSTNGTGGRGLASHSSLTFFASGTTGCSATTARLYCLEI